MSRQKITGLLFYLLASLYLLSTAQAALAPEHNTNRIYSEMLYANEDRMAAADVATIHITAVEGVANEGDGCPQIDEYTVTAIVKAVERGDLHAGDAITISYRSEYYLCPGPQTRNPRQLQKGSDYSAYLNCKQSQCRLGGGSWSFHSEKEFEQALGAIEIKKARWD